MATEKRLIDGNALLKQIDFEYDLGYGEILTDPRQFAYMVEDAPTVDAVEVVRCKDCKYCDRYKNWSGKEYWGCTWISDEYHVVDEDHFCSYGERRE